MSPNHPMKSLALEKTFTLIEPGPVLLVSTARAGKANLMTISWTMVMDFSPRFALLTGAWNYSYEALVKTRECVLAVPGADLARKTVQIGSCSGRDTDKFAKFGLTPIKAKLVKAPLVKECIANIECRVVDHLKEHGIFVLDAVAAWTDGKPAAGRMFHAVGDGTFVVDGRRLNYRRIMAAKLPEGVR